MMVFSRKPTVVCRSAHVNRRAMLVTVPASLALSHLRIAHADDFGFYNTYKGYNQVRAPDWRTQQHASQCTYGSGAEWCCLTLSADTQPAAGLLYSRAAADSLRRGLQAC